MGEFCSKCGIEIEERDYYCPKCGAQIIRSPENVNIQEEGKKYLKGYRDNKKKKVLYLCVGALILILGIVLIKKIVSNMVWEKRHEIEEIVANSKPKDYNGVGTYRELFEAFSDGRCYFSYKKNLEEYKLCDSEGETIVFKKEKGDHYVVSTSIYFSEDIEYLMHEQDFFVYNEFEKTVTYLGYRVYDRNEEGALDHFLFTRDMKNVFEIVDAM